MDLRLVGALVEPLSMNEKAIMQAWDVQKRMYWKPRTALVFGLGTIGILAAMIFRWRGLDTYIYSRESSRTKTVLRSVSTILAQTKYRGLRT